MDIGVNKNRDSPYTMACLPGENYSETNLGSTYLVPVRTHITTQDDFKKVHVSAHNKKKELIDAGDYQKGKHQHPELRKPSKEYKKQDHAVRKKADHYLREGRPLKRKSDAEIQNDFQLRFETLGGVGIVSPEKAILHCRTKTKFFGKWGTKVGLRAVGMHGEKE